MANLTPLKITSFNCQGFKDRNYNYIIDLFNDCNILLLQETWLYNFEHNNFNNILISSQHHAVSAMDEEIVGRIGRPHGGCAIIWHQSLNMSVIPINTISSRVCAVQIKSENVNCVVVSIYMPNDDNSNNTFEVFGDVLYELSTLTSLYDDSDIILGGDFNVDFNRIQSRNLNLFKHFINDEELICPSIQITANNFTREDILGNRSFIDHILLTKNINYANTSIRYDGNNLSDHNPITMNISYNVKSLQQYANRCKVMNWSKASALNIQNYKEQLNYHMNQYQIPEEVLNCNNLLCEEHDNIIMQKLEELFNILIVSAHDTIPIQFVNGKKGIPGWNEFVKPYKEKSIFWNDVWKSADMPRIGQLAELRRFSRAKYHWAIKQVKREKDNIVLYNTAQQLASKSFHEFWITIKKLNGNNKTIANVVDDKNSDNEIAAIFNDKYLDLYNSVPDVNFNITINDVGRLVDEKCNKNQCKTFSDHTVTYNVVENAIKSLKKGKDDEIFEMYSDHFINASESVLKTLSQLLTTMLRHGTTSSIINKSVIKPIPKDKKKSLSDSTNYRAISKNSIMSKIIDYVIMQLIDDKMTTSAYQFGYKENFSTTLCSFLVSETIQYYRSHGSNVYMTLLDCSKAFDKIQHTKLFNTLIEKDICPTIIRLIMNSYIMSTAVVKWNKSTATPFKISNGVKQGGVISAPLFALYIDPLIKKLNNSKQGCYIGQLASNAFAYADDIVLLTPKLQLVKFLKI